MNYLCKASKTVTGVK